MSEMLDRVARVMCDAIGPLGLECTCNPGTCLMPETRRIAALAIAAMREPTDAMVEAAINNTETDRYADIWREMIDAALAVTPVAPDAVTTPGTNTSTT